MGVHNITCFLNQWLCVSHIVTPHIIMKANINQTYLYAGHTTNNDKKVLNSRILWYVSQNNLIKKKELLDRDVSDTLQLRSLRVFDYSVVQYCMYCMFESHRNRVILWTFFCLEYNYYYTYVHKNVYFWACHILN